MRPCPFRGSAFLATGMAALVLLLLASPPSKAGETDAQELAKKLSNPVASLVSVPFQFNYDHGYGSRDGDKLTLNIQPVIPISLNDNWNLVVRTILPVVWQNDIAGASGTQFGLSDTVQSFFFSPAAPSASGITWGFGPVMAYPTGTDQLLTASKWGAGPTGVILKQDGHWLYGVLANHVWSYAGPDGRDDVNATFAQPFLTYTTPTAWTFALNTEATYDWTSAAWSIPIHAQVSKLVTVGEHPISLQAGLRYWAASPDNGPEGLGGRLAITFIFPK